MNTRKVGRRGGAAGFVATAALALVSALAMGGAAQASGPVAATQADLNAVWILISAALVLFMQLGFMLLEAGLVRSKNSINVAQKNLTDFCVVVACYLGVGYMLMFGAKTAGGWVGFEPRLLFSPGDSEGEMAFFVFQAAFCGAAGTIVSGAVAERFGFKAYLLTMPVIAILIYPVFGGWAWGNLLESDNPSWLADLGFIDFAGSTVVHSVGAWVALAAILMVGPRLGRYDAEGRPQRIQGHSMVLATGGALVLLVGWLGFNGGSTLTGGHSTPHVIANTVIAAVIGGCAGLLFGAMRDGCCRPERSINGLLGGLVAITAGCDAATGSGAALIGALGAAATFFGGDWLERLGVDDAIGAVGVHGFAGAAGTLAIALVAPVSALPAGGPMAQLGVQALGVATAFAWTMSISLAWFWLLGRMTPLRVEAQAEREGLNTAEHGSTLGLGEIERMLAETVRGEADLSTRLTVEPGDEAAELAELFNQLMARLEAEETRRQFIEGQRRSDDETRLKREQARLDDMRRLQEGQQDLVMKITEVIGKVEAHDLTARADLGARNGALVEAGRGVNRLLDFLANLVRMLENSISEVEQACGEQLRGSETLLRAADSQKQAIGDATGKLQTLQGAVREISSIGAETRAGVDHADRSVAKGREATVRAVEAMDVVKQKSMLAHSVVEMIEDVASQTNILAINAATQAARAGAHGKEFKVVSDEVRALSQRTSELSVQISKILSESAESVATAVKRVETSAEALGEIADGSEAMLRSVAAIIDCAERQAEQSDALLAAVERVATLGGETSQVADAAAAASKQLLSHAASLHEAVGDYKTPPARVQPNNTRAAG